MTTPPPPSAAKGNHLEQRARGRDAGAEAEDRREEEPDETAESSRMRTGDTRRCCHR